MEVSTPSESTTSYCVNLKFGDPKIKLDSTYAIGFYTRGGFAFIIEFFITLFSSKVGLGTRGANTKTTT